MNDTSPRVIVSFNGPTRFVVGIQYIRLCKVICFLNGCIRLANNAKLVPKSKTFYAKTPVAQKRVAQTQSCRIITNIIYDLFINYFRSFCMLIKDCIDIDILTMYNKFAGS